ncbi:MAG: hypothetical protein N3E40_07840, partial [Dehalococcoidia bacterium]|nr:hypothetical protein [Dehalococcoidia bacterium]
MNKKVWYSVLVAIVMASLLLIGACGQPPPTAPQAPKPSPTAAPAPAPAPSPTPYKWPAEFKVATAAIGSTSNAMLAALGPAIEKGTGMKVRIVPEDNIPLK